MTVSDNESARVFTAYQAKRASRDQAKRASRAATIADLILCWREHLYRHTGEFVGSLTPKEAGQLQLFLLKVGADRALPVLKFALANWPLFQATATGVPCPTSAVPAIGLLLMHRDVLLALISRQDDCN